MIFDCVRCKLAIVAADEHDGGRRQVLNLGHTVGHAIETATGYARYRHGEAVGLGLLAALELSGQRELRDQVAALLERARAADALRGRRPGGRDRRQPARQEAPRRRASRSCSSTRPGAVRHGAAVAPDELEAAVAALCR